MKHVKSILLLLYYIFLIVLAVGLVYYNETLAFLESLQSDDGGILLSLYFSVFKYFQNADSWNLIFLAFTVSVLLVFYVINDLAVERAFTFLSVRFKKLNWMSATWFRMIFQKGFSTFLLLAEFVILLNIMVIGYSSTRMVEVEEIKDQKQVLLLGTNKHIRGTESPNLYYSYRINAVEEAYNAGVVKEIIISGDRTDSLNYNEPQDMKDDLVARGVPADIIKLDYEGFRTLDSILRTKAMYNLDNVLVISQKFHVERALFQAWFYEINSWGLPSAGTMTNAMVIREAMAKPKVIMDLFFFNMQPRSGKAVEREGFTVTSDLHVALIILLFMLFVSSFTLVVRNFNLSE